MFVCRHDPSQEESRNGRAGTHQAPAGDLRLHQAYSAKYGYPPTVRDIGKAVGLASSSTVHAHLANLEKIGLLRRDPSKPRALELLDRAAGARACATSSGRRPAARRARSPPASRSSPRRTSRSTSRSRRWPAATTGEYVLRVRGDSMKNAGILEGDYVVVRPQDTRRRRRDRRRARRRGGDRQALLPRGRPRPPAARERRAWSRSAPGGPRPRPRRRRLLRSAGR